MEHNSKPKVHLMSSQSRIIRIWVFISVFIKPEIMRFLIKNVSKLKLNKILNSGHPNFNIFCENCMFDII
jgi:hypothetical protein